MKRSESRIGVPHGGQSLETTGSRGRRTKRGPAGFRILTDWLPRLQPRVLGAGVQRRHGSVTSQTSASVTRREKLHGAPGTPRVSASTLEPNPQRELLMSVASRLAVCGAVSLILVAPVRAQEHEHGGAPGEQLGHVAFATSCRPDAQARFERAMALLHSFWWEEGARAFRAVAAADSTCAMAYWGLALNYWGNPFVGGPQGDNLRRGAANSIRALALGAPTAREQGFLAAVGALYRDYETTSNPRRLQAYSDTLARVNRDFPTDPEVAIYYALSLVATASPADTTFTRQRQAAAILNPLFRRFPEHPGLAHYIIHANDSPQLASLGLEAARRYAPIAPSAPHAQHMPSHIFVRLGLWDETIAANQRSLDAGIAYARAQHLGGVVGEQFHALAYMVYAYLQQGRDSTARRTVARGAAGGGRSGGGGPGGEGVGRAGGRAREAPGDAGRAPAGARGRGRPAARRRAVRGSAGGL